MTEKEFDIGPRDLSTSENRFLLNTSEWIAIQSYTSNALNLPTNLDVLRSRLPAEPPGGMNQFSDLVDAYSNLNRHCKDWNDNTLQDSVNCASNIVHYNTKVPIYYGALTKILPKLEQEPPDEEAIKQFKAILANLTADAKANGDHAERVYNGMKAFAENTEADGKIISALHGKYQKLFGDQSPDISRISAELKEDIEELGKWNKKYEHDVIVAATTPTYCWVWPLGTIASAIVAGIYGKKATDALKRVKEYKAKAKLLSDQLEASASMMADLEKINIDLNEISDNLNTALPIIQKMQGIWNSIESDLLRIQEIIDKDIDQVPAIIKSLGIDEAIDAWDKVSVEADSYRVNAFIKVIPEDAAKDAGKAFQKALNANRS